MYLQINGESREFDDGLTLQELLDKLEFAGKYVAVERNLEVVSYKKYAETILHEGDCLEIVSLVGGG